MSSQSFPLFIRRAFALAALAAMATVWMPGALGQTGGGGDGGGGTGGGGTGGGGTGGGGTGGGTTGTGPFSGVAIDANGVLERQEVADPTGRLLQMRLQQAEAKLAPDVARTSELRKVSRASPAFSTSSTTPRRKTSCSRVQPKVGLRRRAVASSVGSPVAP
jgi:hypothetical protein